MNLSRLNLATRAEWGGTLLNDPEGRSRDPELQRLRDEHERLERELAEQAERRQLEQEKDELRLENARLRSQLI